MPMILVDAEEAGLAAHCKINERHARPGVYFWWGWTDCSVGANPDSPRLWSQLHLAEAPGVCVL